MKNNIAGKIASIFIQSKLTPLIVVACLLAGWLSLQITPREENPQISAPGASILISLPGATALEIEELVTNPIESIIKQIAGVDDIRSISRNSSSLINVQFETGQDKEKSLIKLYDRVQGGVKLLPKGTHPPIITSIDVDDVPIVTVTLHSNQYDDLALKRISESVITQLRSIEGVSSLYTRGGADREIRVAIDPERLQAYGITIDSASKWLSSANTASNIGNYANQNSIDNVFLDGFITSVEQLKKIVIGKHEKRLIYVEDVAEVLDGSPEDRNTLSRFSWGLGDPRYKGISSSERSAVTIAIAKQKGRDSVVVASRIVNRLDRIIENHIPPGVVVEITRNDGQVADNSVNTLVEHLGIAILSVFLVLVLFLGFKEAIIVSLAVPLVLSITLTIDYLFGMTINRMTLFALILSLGLLVDAAIVVIENIHRQYKSPLHGSEKKALLVNATNEIGNPTNLATFAIMLVFASLILLTGLPEPYFFPITFNVPIAMFASVVIAYIVVPWSCNYWLNPGENHPLEEHKKENKLHKIYYHVMRPILEKGIRKKLLFAITALLFIGSITQPAWQFIRTQGIGGPLSIGGVAVGMLPKNDKNTFNITIDMPENSPVELTDSVARDIGSILLTSPMIMNYQTWIGQTGIVDFNGLFRGRKNQESENIAEIRVNLVDIHDRDISSTDIINHLRNEVKPISEKYPNSVIKLIEDPQGPPVQATVTAEIYGPKLKDIRNLSNIVKKEFESTYGIIEVDSSEPSQMKEVKIVVDKEKAALSDVTTIQIQRVLTQLINGSTLGAMHIPGEKKQVQITLRVPDRYRIDPTKLFSVYVTNSSGHKIPISELVNIDYTNTERPILHKNNERVTYVYGETNDISQVYAVLDLNQRLSNLSLANGTSLTTGNLSLREDTPDPTLGNLLFWDGEMRITLDIFRDLGAALTIALMMIFLILVAYYQSFSIPLIAMSAIPLGIIGVFPGHWLMGEIFSGTSLIGVIALSGVVVRNSLLIIDFVLQNVKHEIPLEEAILKGGATRFRPILLTSLAIILGTSVMLSDSVFGGLAISLIFGTITATILTLIVVPALLYLHLKKFKYKKSF